MDYKKLLMLFSSGIELFFHALTKRERVGFFEKYAEGEFNKGKFSMPYINFDKLHFVWEQDT